MKTPEEMLAANRDAVMPRLLAAVTKNDAAEESQLVDAVMADSFDPAARGWLALFPPKRIHEKFLKVATEQEAKVLSTEAALACINRLQTRLNEALKAKKAAARAAIAPKA